MERPEHADSGPDYFRLFDFPRRYFLDTAELQARYRRLQQQLHPDRFAGGTPREQRLALQRTGLVNRAFQVLQSPVERARHLLECAGLHIDPEQTTAADPEFLMRQIEVREQLARQRQQGDTASLEALAQQADADFSSRAQAFAAAIEGGAWEEAGALFLKMQFLARLGAEITAARREVA